MVTILWAFKCVGFCEIQYNCSELWGPLTAKVEIIKLSEKQKLSSETCGKVVILKSIH